MIYKNGKDITGIHIDKKEITSVYSGKNLVWELNNVISCYAKGYWIDDNPWTDDTTWSDETK